jgi:hypothetical protein
MAGIEKHSDSNYGGIAQLYVAIHRDIKDIFDLDFERVALSISLANFETHFDRLHFVRRKAGHDFQKQNESYNHIIEASFLSQREEVRKQIEKGTNTKLCFIYKSLNGQWLMVPFATESTTFSTGKAPKDSNEYTMRWESSLGHAELPITII